ncbi:hypothetical protein DFH06DRAFT_1323260 [Mycena polygramma]|nr:hypothetical protein DFH06DRAFT_1323260 [Mycena polygramma]
MLVAVALLPLLFPFSFTLASFIVDSVTKAALTCEPVLLQWQGGVAPWTLECAQIVDADGDLIENLGSFKGTSFHWTADVAAVVAAQVTDSKGAIATSNSFTVQPGTTGCPLQSNQFAVTSPTSSSASGISSPASVTSSSTSGTSSSDSGTSSSDSRTISSTILQSAASTVGLSASATSDAATYSAVQASTQPSPSSDALARKPNKKKPSVGMVFAVLIPCLIVLAIIGLLLFCWRRRRRETLSALEAQRPNAHWSERSAYRSSFNLDRTPSAAVTPNPRNTKPVPQRPALNIVTPNRAVARPESGRTPVFLTAVSTTPPSAIPYGESKYVETLESRITALVAENALLANLASPQRDGDMPPPPYA